MARQVLLLAAAATILLLATSAAALHTAAECPCLSGKLPGEHPSVDALMEKAKAAIAAGNGCPFKFLEGAAGKCPCLNRTLPAAHPPVFPEADGIHCPLRHLHKQLSEAHEAPAFAEYDTHVPHRCPVTGKVLNQVSTEHAKASNCPFARLFAGSPDAAVQDANDCPCLHGKVPQGHPDIAKLTKEAADAVARGEGCPFKELKGDAMKCPCLRAKLPAGHPEVTKRAVGESDCPLRHMWDRLGVRKRDVSASEAPRRCPITGKALDAVPKGEAEASGCPFARLFAKAGFGKPTDPAKCPCLAGKLPEGHADIAELTKKIAEDVKRGLPCPFKHLDGTPEAFCPCLNGKLPEGHPDIGILGPKNDDDAAVNAKKGKKVCPLKHLWDKSVKDANGDDVPQPKRCPITGKLLSAVTEDEAKASGCPFARLWAGTPAATKPADEL